MLKLVLVSLGFVYYLSGPLGLVLYVLSAFVTKLTLITSVAVVFMVLVLVLKAKDELHHHQLRQQLKDVFPFYADVIYYAGIQDFQIKEVITECFEGLQALEEEELFQRGTNTRKGSLHFVGSLITCWKVKSGLRTRIVATQSRCTLH